MALQQKEKFSFYSHLAAAFGAFALSVFLLRASATSVILFLTTLAYCASAVFLFCASAAYHYKKKEENETSLWRKLDHLAIFFMIAGTYTPMSFMFLNGRMMISIIAAQWILAALGLIFKLYFINAPRYLSTALYLAMGWIVLIPLKYFWEALPGYIIVYTALGAIAFTLGGIVYATKRPACRPGIFGFHEIFHILIILGWFFHFCMVFSSVMLYHS